MKHSPYLGFLVGFTRKAKGLKQCDVAKKLGISQSAVCRMEKGEATISFDQLCMIADCLGVKASDLVAMYEAAVA